MVPPGCGQQQAGAQNKSLPSRPGQEGKLGQQGYCGPQTTRALCTPGQKHREGPGVVGGCGCSLRKRKLRC